MHDIYLIVRAFFDPVAFSIAIITFGLWQLKGLKTDDRGRFGWWLICCGVALLYSLSIAPVSKSLFYFLEKDFIHVKENGTPDLDYIVILGGGVDQTIGGKFSPACDSFTRVHFAANLLKNSDSKMVFSGTGEKVAESEVMASFARELGTKESRIIIESNSRNTKEHAFELSKIIDKQAKIGLATSGYHMKRSMTEFEKYFENLYPLPTSFSSSFKFHIREIIPSHAYLGQSATALHEYLGLLWYKLI